MILEDFLADCIDSAEQIEILLLLAGRTDRWLSAKQVADELLYAESATAYDLHALADRRLLAVQRAVETEYRLVPASPALARGVAALIDRYQRDRRGLLDRVIASKGRSLRHFALSFTFRRDR